MNEENFQEQDEYQSTFQPRPVDQQILADPDPHYRVLDLSRDPFNDAVPAYFHKHIGGYSPAKLESYQDLIDVHMAKGFNIAVLQMLNTKYIITPGGQGGQPAVFPMQDPAGNAWFVEEVKWAASADEQMLAMNAPKLGDTAMSAPGAFQPKKTAVIRNTYKDALNGYAFGKDSAASIKLKQYGLNKISYTSSNSKPGLAVFSEIWYPHGWKAFIDGKEEPIIQANYLLRALKIPAGQHTIEFRFEPKSFASGNRITMICSLLIILLSIAGLIAAFRQKPSDTEPVEPIVEPTTAAAPKPTVRKQSKG
jgi:hypothetical protein